MFIVTFLATSPNHIMPGSLLNILSQQSCDSSQSHVAKFSIFMGLMYTVDMCCYEISLLFSISSKALTITFSQRNIRRSTGELKDRVCFCVDRVRNNPGLYPWGNADKVVGGRLPISLSDLLFQQIHTIERLVLSRLESKCSNF